MSSPEAFTAIKTRINANFDDCPVYYENEPARPPNTPATHVFVEVRTLGYGQESIGADPQDQNLWREHGLLAMHVMVKKGTGSLEARTVGKNLGLLFKAQDVDGIIYGDQIRGPGEPRPEDGNYWRFTVEVEWQRDEP